MKTVIDVRRVSRIVVALAVYGSVRWRHVARFPLQTLVHSRIDRL